MSNHVVEDNQFRWLFGWDQRYRSFFLIKRNKTLPDDENPVLQLGMNPREIPTADDLITLAHMAGLDIPQDNRIWLYRDDKDFEQDAYFVLHYPNELASGFRVDTLAQAEMLKEALERNRPNQELQIRRVMQFQ